MAITNLSLNNIQTYTVGGATNYFVPLRWNIPNTDTESFHLYLI